MHIRDLGMFKSKYGSHKLSRKTLPTYTKLYMHFVHIFIGNKKNALKQTCDELINIWISASLIIINEKSNLSKTNEILRNSI